MNRQDQATLKMIVPGIIQALAISPCGSFCVGGAAEQLFVWLVSTGRMMACLRRHYQNVNGVFFTSNSCNFVSIGADNLVLLWNMETVLDSSSVILIFFSFIMSCQYFLSFSCRVKQNLSFHGQTIPRLLRASTSLNR